MILTKYDLYESLRKESNDIDATLYKWDLFGRFSGVAAFAHARLMDRYSLSREHSKGGPDQRL